MKFLSRNVPVALFFILFVVGCSRIPTRSLHRGSEGDASLFLALPDSPTVHQNYIPLLYQSLWDRFRQSGYNLKTHPPSRYSLEVRIKDVSTIQRYLSPDVVPYGYRIEIALHCRLLSDGDEIGSHDVHSSGIVSSSKDARLRMSFIKHEMGNIFKRLARLVDRWVRSRMAEGIDAH